MILSDVLLLMTSQGPADHRAGQRDRCAPLESGFQWKDTRQSPLSAGPILSSRNPPDSSGSTLTCRGQLTGAWVSPRSQFSEQAHWSQPGCGPRRLAGQLLPSTDKTTDRCYTCSKQPLPHPIKELIIDFLALLSNCLMIAFLRAVNRVKTAPNSIPQRRNLSRR